MNAANAPASGTVAAQELLLPPSLRNWLPESHLACFVSDMADQPVY